MEIISNSVAQTLKIGRRIAKNLKPADIICLFGQLGTGKTILTKGIGQGLGIKKDKIISSSFILIRTYSQGKFPLYHFDLYRLRKTNDIIALGYEEYLYGNGVTVIEWADRLNYLLPEEFLKIELIFKTKKQRLLKFSASGSRYRVLLKKISDEDISC